MKCSESSCLVAFDVRNRSKGTLPIIYEIALSQHCIREPNKSGLIVVGSASGEFVLPPNDTKTLEVDVVVTERPDGSLVSVADSRTPGAVLEILGF